MRATTLATLGLVAALSVGCSNGSGKTAAQSNISGSPTASPSAGAGSGTPSPFSTRATRKADSAALLTIADFPPGWSTSSNGGSGGFNTKRLGQTLGRCLGVPPSVFTGGSDQVEVDSPEFDAPNGRDHSVDESIDSGSPAEMAAEYRTLHLAAFPRCMTTAIEPILKSALGKQAAKHHVTIGHTTIGQLSVPALGQDTLGFRVTVPLMVRRVITVPIYVDLVFARDSSSDVVMSFMSLATPFRASLADELTKLAYQKLDRANTTTT
jgi:hypothetical protein